MAKDYYKRFRGCSRLAPLCKAELLEALSVGAPIEIAGKAAGIVKDTFYRWRRGGKARHLGRESPDFPYFAHRQPDETDEAFIDRKYHCDWDCALMEDLYLSVMRTIAGTRVAWMRRMAQRALEDEACTPTPGCLSASSPSATPS